MENKNFISFFFSIMLLFLISACSSDNSFEQSKTENSVSQWHHAVMSLNISKENFDAKGSAATRATSDEWQDGDKLYLRFVTFNGIVIGTATYDDSKGMWNVSYNGTLDKNVESQLFVVFLDNIEQENNAQTRGFGTVPDPNIIKLDCYHGVYMDENGTYILDAENKLKVKAILKSQTSRVRIKGDTADENFKLIGLTCYTAYNPKTHVFTTSEEVVKTKTDKNKQSDYIYVQSLTENNRQIMLGRWYNEGSYIFKAICSKDIFVVGKSGIVNMPSKSQHNGWNMKQVSGYDENEHYWVDLDLPSGTIWAEENFGADQSEWLDTEDGKYLLGNQCMWGSVDYTSWSHSATDIGGTSDDIVTKAWGKKWRIPSKKDFEELKNKDNIKTIISYENYYNNSYCKVKGVEVVGKNDEVLFFLDRYEQDNHTYYCNGYWTSTPFSSTEAYYFYSFGWDLGYNGTKSSILCIKPVMK